MPRKILKAAIAYAQAGNPTRFGELINQALAVKVADRIDQDRVEVSQDVLQYEPIGEGLEPRAQGEKKFVALHQGERREHPVAPDDQFKGRATPRMAKRPPDQDAGDRDGFIDDPDTTVSRLKNLMVKVPGIFDTTEGKSYKCCDDDGDDGHTAKKASKDRRKARKGRDMTIEPDSKKNFGWD